MADKEAAAATEGDKEGAAATEEEEDMAEEVRVWIEVWDWVSARGELQREQVGSYAGEEGYGSASLLGTRQDKHGAIFLFTCNMFKLLVIYFYL